MAVKIGSARIDENGTAKGGKAGDQTGKEVSTQNWYLSSKGWRVFRCIDPTKAAKIAKCMKAACANKHIGYDQSQRLTLYKAAKQYGFDVSKVTENVETDCSALVRVCMAYAGITASNFTTATEATALLNTGEFVELTDAKYRTKSSWLKAGDILTTKTKGHTVVVLTDGENAERNAIIDPEIYDLGDRMLCLGIVGDDVRELQTMLIAIGYSCGVYGADGEYGDNTVTAVKNFQRDYDLEVDGIAGEKTIAMLNVCYNKPIVSPKRVKIISRSCNVRNKPNISGSVIGILLNRNTRNYAGETAEDERGVDWYKVEIEPSRYGWVSSKYSRLE